jgi:hypothetical protein
MTIRILGGTALLAWFAATTALATATLALHEAPLPTPRSATVAATGQASMDHALAAECPCSGRVLDYLEKRGATPGATERVLLVGADAPRAERLRARGFEVREIDEHALLDTYGIPAAPALVVRHADGTVAYQGAYAPRPQMDPIDLELLAVAQAGGTRDPMAILGCAVSRSLQDRLDPFGIKYALWSR